MLKFKKISSIILSTLMIFGISTNLSGNLVHAAEQKESIKTYTSTDTTDNNYNNFKTTLSVTFIEDENDDKFTAFVSTEGSFIPSGLTRMGSSYEATMNWPSIYRTIVSSYDKNSNVKIVKSIPINQVKSTTVSETMGYSVGGNISAEKGSEGPKIGASLEAAYNASRSVNYDQPDYNTLLTKDSKNSAEWQVMFNENKDGYNRDSQHALYGNQLFMKARLNYWGDKNLTDMNNLSSLITGGFSPKVVVALKAPKDIKNSRVAVQFSRFNDKYKLKWDGAEWYGKNIKGSCIDSTQTTFELDWKNHTVKYLY